MYNMATEVKAQVILMPGEEAAVSNVIDVRDLADHIGIQIHLLPDFEGDATVNIQTTTEDPASLGNPLVGGWGTVSETEPFSNAANFSIEVSDENPEFVANGQAVITAQLTCRSAFLRATLAGGSSTEGIVVIAVGKPKRTAAL